ncbi:MAG: hypothetical protein ACXVP0_16400, partial [Bacteroidia bacterium]
MAIAIYVKNKNYDRKKKKYYQYFIPALLCKIIGGVSLCLIYTYYYEGGDVTNYYFSTCTFVNVLLDGEVSKFFDILNIYKNSFYDVFPMNSEHGNIFFSPKDYYAMFTVVLTVPMCLIACKSFFATTIVLAGVSFIGLWKLYEVFVDQFPDLMQEFAIAIFFIPSVFFWGSGILKDTYTLSSIGFYSYGIYKYLILKQRHPKYLMMLLGAATVIVLIKPYIFFALLPGSLIWIFFDNVNSIKSKVVRTLIIPFSLTALYLVAIFLLNYFGQYLGEYSLDNVLNKAVKTQQDLIRDQYGGNNFNIGEFDASVAGIMSKIPAAMNMALFRPYIWDAKNPVMLLSGLENFFLLGFTIFILLRVKITTLFRSLFSHPLLIFSFLFALFFAFS